MQIDVQTKSRSLLGVSDLTVVAPIKRGLIPALDARSYESRARLLMRTLNALRISSREAELTPLIDDTVDRIRALQSFRLAIVGDLRPQLLLSVAFDGGWEPYMRRIWRDLGPLLDVIFCNCEGYPLALENDFATYANWVRSSQVTTEFFYNASSLTVNDLHYLRAQEAKRLAPLNAVAAAALEGNAKRDAVVAQSLAPLCALYRASDMYPPFTADGTCLLRAADYLLRELSSELHKNPGYANGLEQDPKLAPSERAAVKWFRTASWPAPLAAAHQDWNPSAVQGGILAPSQGVTHACLLLLELRDAAAAEALLKHAESSAISESAQREKDVPQLLNIFFTLQGLRAAGVPEATLELMPFEFREGMAPRAGILGDYLGNHPTRWRLPERNWPPSNAAAEPIELSSVHVVVQLAARARQGLEWLGVPGQHNHPLSQCLTTFDAKLGSQGVRILSVQPMQRYIHPGDELPRGHFGYVDGISQPMPQSPNPQPWERVALGDFLLGHPNSRGDPPQTGRLWDDSTFLVIRKLRQDVQAFNDALPKGSPEALHAKAQLMGRDVNGVSAVSRDATNAFDYTSARGELCPIHSHVRRANPRTSNSDEPAPRIIRRGMSYGPLPDQGNAGEDRGLMFMAFNASIAEQFEVIQSWLSGGNSQREQSFSGLRDPILGIANQGDPLGIEYMDATRVRQVLPINPGRPFVTLEWGLYLFVPSIKALGELTALAHEAAQMEGDKPTAEYARKKEDRRKLLTAVDAQKGAVAIARLKLAEQALGLEAARDQWKIALEDVGARMSGVSQWIWATVRQMHGGVLRTPYGVLVCSREKVKEVFENRTGNYTATGYGERMAKSFGEIYLGKDAGEQYLKEAAGANRVIQNVGRAKAFQSAYGHAEAVLRHLASTAKEETLEVKDFVDDVLADLCRAWFGLPDGQQVAAGGWHWRDDGVPTCPGHFHSPSRYMFQPNPGKETSDTGQAHGQMLNVAVREWVMEHRRKETVPVQALSGWLFHAIPDDDERLTRTIIGVLMGFLPTVDGNLRATLYEWVNDRSLWDLQIQYCAEQAGGLAAAEVVLLPALIRTMQLRPVPELTWRIALRKHDLGQVEVRAGETVVISIVSAMQECLADDDEDIYAVFGGARQRDGENLFPTHACPGYEMALGVLLGTLAALLDRTHLRPTLSPMALKMRLRFP